MGLEERHDVVSARSHRLFGDHLHHAHLSVADPLRPHGRTHELGLIGGGRAVEAGAADDLELGRSRDVGGPAVQDLPRQSIGDHGEVLGRPPRQVEGRLRRRPDASLLPEQRASQHHCLARLTSARAELRVGAPALGHWPGAIVEPGVSCVLSVGGSDLPALGREPASRSLHGNRRRALVEPQREDVGAPLKGSRDGLYAGPVASSDDLVIQVQLVRAVTCQPDLGDGRLHRAGEEGCSDQRLQRRRVQRRVFDLQLSLVLRREGQ